MPEGVTPRGYHARAARANLAVANAAPLVSHFAALVDAPYLIFAQRNRAEVDLAGLVGNTRRYFSATVSVISASEGSVRIRLEHGDERAELEIVARLATEADHIRAERAEVRGKAAGMAALARRCSVIWQVQPDPGVSERATLRACALLASVALGPVLPADDSTLFGVRGALARAE
jgi:hypothetical protein